MAGYRWVSLWVQAQCQCHKRIFEIITFRLKAKDNKLYIDSINNCHSNHYGTHNTFPLHNTPLGKDRQHTTTRTPVGTTLILNLSRFRNGIPGYGVVMGVSMRDVRTAY
jgi:hypothetical protein